MRKKPLRAILAEFPNGQFADLARIRPKRMEADSYSQSDDTWAL